MARDESTHELWRAFELGERAAGPYALTPPRRTAAGISGTRAGSRAGGSMEFQEYRDYQPGDDLRHLDWAAFARSDRLVVRRFHEEVVPHLDLLLDTSRSMVAGGSSKPAATLHLAGFFARAAIHGGFTHTTWGLGGAAGGRPLGPPGSAPRAWTGLTFDGVGSPIAELAGAGELRPGGLRVLLSDLLWPESPERALAVLGRAAATVVVVELLTHDELEPVVEPTGPVRLVDVEDGRTLELELDTAAVERYRRALELHRRAWRRACRSCGAVVVAFTAEDLLEAAAADRFAELVRAGVVEAS